MAQTYASYTYTPNGQVATLKDAKNNLTSYQYDGQEGKVTTLYPSKTAVNTSSSTDTEQYSFDNNANLTSLIKRSGQVINFAYDNLNRLLTRSYTNSSENVNFSYDSDNRLETALSTDLATPVNAALSYDAQGRLRQTQINIGGNNKTSQLLYDGVDLVAEYDTTTQALQRRYVHGPGVDEPLVWYEGAGTTAKSWLYADHLGSIIATANASGASSTINTYGPFGESAQTTPDNNRFGYTGQQQLKGLGLNYYKARVYSPALGRFLQVDPIGVADDLNLYGYVGNGPINLNDPSGLVAGWLTGTALAGGNAVDNLLFGGYAQSSSQAFGTGNFGEGLLNFDAGDWHSAR